ncbi:nucleoside diphosphate kinase regulator [Rheinheimera sp. 1928-s]|uniref:nucleoside diphosphate kinase regulator n=1 Tax=Rheinheimera sp. 1928-s TaxID=3033803 RepID=UPI0031F7E1DA
MTIFIKKTSAKTDVSALFFMASSAIHPLPPWQLQHVLQQLGAVANHKRKALSETGIVPGCSVRLLDLSDQTESWITLVYPQQAKPEQGFISVLSPLGAALLGKNVGQVAEVQLFRRTLRFMLCDLMSVKQPPAFTFTPSVQEKLMNQTLPDPALPELLLSSLDLDRLDALLSRLPPTDPARLGLEQELERGAVVEPEEMPKDVVTMNSTVRLRLLKTGEEPCLTLVYPKDLDAAGDKVSVLAPVGSALLGLREGDEIHWPMPDGDIQPIQVLQLLYQPERAGQLHR